MTLMSVLSAQKRIDFSSELLKSSDSKTSSNYAKYFQNAETEMEMAYTGLFVFYKACISSQDGSTCSFTPSCSEYAVQAIEKFGPIRGPMMFMDRYTRCNSLSPRFYKRDVKKSKLIDEVGDF